MQYEVQLEVQQNRFALTEPMQASLKEIMKNIDTVVIQILNVNPNQDVEKLRKKVYEQFAQKLGTTSPQVTQQLRNALKQINQNYLDVEQPKRGRPRKNTNAEKLLVQWMKSLKTNSLTKKQIDSKYKQLTNGRRTISYASLRGIMCTYGVDREIKISKCTKKQRENRVKPNSNDIQFNQQYQMQEQVENKQKQIFIQSNDYLFEFLKDSLQINGAFIPLEIDQQFVFQDFFMGL